MSPRYDAVRHLIGYARRHKFYLCGALGMGVASIGTVLYSFQKVTARSEEQLSLPELCMVLTDTVVIFDNVRQTLKVVATPYVPRPEMADNAYDGALERIQAAGKHRSRNAWYPIQDLTKAAAAGQELAYDEQGPAIADQFERMGGPAGIVIAPFKVRLGGIGYLF